MRRNATIVAVVVVMVLSGASAALAGGSSRWSPAESIETFGAGAHENFNTPSNDGCPFISADGKKFFIATNRPGTLGMNDIYVSTRANKNQAWSEPVPLGGVNTTFNDFCPTLARDGKTFYFASNRPGFCGANANADLYKGRLDSSSLTVTGVTHLGCVVNSGWDEHSPFPLKIKGKLTLFYSSARPANATDAAGDHDLYSSKWRHGAFQAGAQLAGINTTANEGQPNVRKDGKEIFFWSDRVGTTPGVDGTLGAADIFSSSKKKNGWSTPKNLGPNVNSAAAETRPSLSSNGKVLYFGTTRNAGGQPLADVYVTRR